MYVVSGFSCFFQLVDGFNSNIIHWKIKSNIKMCQTIYHFCDLWVWSWCIQADGDGGKRPEEISN